MYQGDKLEKMLNDLLFEELNIDMISMIGENILNLNIGDYLKRHGK